MIEILTDSFKLPISEENAFLIPIIAPEFGYIEGSDISPKETILNHFRNKRLETRGRVYNALSKYFGESEKGKATVAQIMDLYDAEGVSEISFNEKKITTVTT